MGDRWRGVAVIALGAAVAVPALVGPAATAQTQTPTPGFGQAVGQLVRLDPKASGLSFGFELGAAKAGHQQYTSRASSRVFDTGLIGLSLAGVGCTGGDPTWPLEDQPQAITVDSRDEGAGEGESADEVGFDRFVSALPLPLSTASIVSEPLGIPGVVDVVGARADARSGMEVAGVREARASVDIGGVSLLGGLVTLRGLRWESLHRGGTEELSTGSFRVASLEIGGVPVPIADVDALFDAANTVLGAFGIRLGHPEVHESGGVLFVDPLAIEIEPNAARDAVTGGVMRALQPVREQLFDAIIAAYCDFASLVTLYDILVGSITGAGTFSIELGGTEATTEPIAATGGLGAAPGQRAGAPAPSAPAPTTGPTVARRPPTTRPAVTVPPATAIEEAGQPIAAPVPDDDPGRDLAAVVGLVTIALGALLVEGDRRSMRRAAAAGAAAPAAQEATTPP